MSAEPQIRSHAAFIWSVADKLDYYAERLYERLRSENERLSLSPAAE
jgi:hypothetical protein